MFLFAVIVFVVDVVGERAMNGTLIHANLPSAQVDSVPLPNYVRPIDLDQVSRLLVNILRNGLPGTGGGEVFVFLASLLMFAFFGVSMKNISAVILLSCVPFWSYHLELEKLQLKSYVDHFYYIGKIFMFIIYVSFLFILYEAEVE